MRQLLVLCVAGVLLGVVAWPGQAAIINEPVPSNAYITRNGLDWAWAHPLPAPDANFSLAYQAQFGWRLPTASELLTAPLGIDFLVAGGNVPYLVSDPVSGAMFGSLNNAYLAAQSAGAVAVPYFSNWVHADWEQGLGQPLGPWAGMAGASTFAEQLVVRVSGVPEPSTLALCGVGVAAMLRQRRRR